MTEAIYVPILKWKQGEYTALKELYASDKALVQPLVEIVPIPTPLDEDVEPATLDEHISKFPNQVESNWGCDQKIWVDASLLAEPAILANGQHAFAVIMAELRKRNVQAVPVVYLDSPILVLQAAAACNEVDGRGVVIRLDEEEADSPTIQRELDSLLLQLGLAASNADIVLDAGSVSPEFVSRTAIICRYVLDRFPYVHEWRSLVFASSGFPVNMAAQAVGVSMIQRSDWLTWQTIKADFDEGRIPRLPVFGDYAIAHPELADIDPRTMQMSANIRYTSVDHWVIFKGRGVRRYGFGQIYDLCTNLVGNSVYRGAGFSFGDMVYKQRADQGDAYGKGNASQWRRDATNHHLTFVVRQVQINAEPVRVD